MRISDWSSDVCSSDLFAAGSLDLVLSVLSLHWVNDLPGTLLQISRALKPDGLLLAAMIGGDSLRELRDALLRAELEVEDGVSPRVSPLADVRSEARPVGKECVSTCRSRWSPDH